MTHHLLQALICWLQAHVGDVERTCNSIQLHSCLQGQFCLLQIDLACSQSHSSNCQIVRPLQWTCGGEQLEIVIDFKYLGILFNALDGMAVTFPMLKKNMFGAWALLKRQYGRLQCLASVGLMFRVYEACVPSTASYGCEIWGFQPFPQQYRILRKSLITSHLQMLKDITGVRGSTSTDILLAELGLKSPDHVWLLRAAKFWNNLAGKPSGNLYRCIALDCCRAAVAASKRNLGMVHVQGSPCYRVRAQYSL